MATEHELKRLFAGLEPSEQELAVYRSKLAATLEARSPRRRRVWVWLAAGGPLLASLAAVVWFFSAPPSLDERTLEEVQALVTLASDHEALRRRAERLEQRGRGRERYNATMVLVLTQPEGKALEAAARGVVTDPRPEFRSFYLEYLLDYADSFELNAEKIEELMEDEDDEVCFDLYARLLRMAERT